MKGNEVSLNVYLCTYLDAFMYRHQAYHFQWPCIIHYSAKWLHIYIFCKPSLLNITCVTGAVELVCMLHKMSGLLVQSVPQISGFLMCDIIGTLFSNI